MKANPGGQIDLSEVVGRDEIIAHIWETLEQQSVRINAERRIGKTTIIRKLRAEPKSNWLPIFQDLEKCHTAMQFAEAVFREVERFLSRYQQTARRAKAFWQAIGGAEIKGVLKLPPSADPGSWQKLLSNAIEDLLETQQQHDKRPLLLWDEVPYMLQNIAKNDGETVAMQVLDVLRELRQSCAGRGLRMILTGSIGFHHVIQALKQQDYANAPLNDTYALEVDPLSPAAALELAARLVSGEMLQVKELDATAQAIAEIADGFPYYIHHIIKALKLSGQWATPIAVEALVTRQLLDANDPWELAHYRTRIPIYYGKAAEETILAALDGVAVSSTPVAVNDLWAELKSTGEIIDRERLLELLRRLEQDHYLSRDQHGHYQFRFPLICRWWRLHRGL